MSISKSTEQYLTENPSIKDSLQKGLINYSKLSRQIISDTRLKNKDFDAILVSLSRIERKLKKTKLFQKKIRELMKETKLEIKTKVMVCIVEKDTFYQNIIELHKEIKSKKGSLNIIEGTHTITIITEQHFEKTIKQFFKSKIIKKTIDLVQILLESPIGLEEVPGVVGYLYSLFSDKGINIVETLSCWTDTIFVVEKKDMEKTVKALDF